MKDKEKEKIWVDGEWSQIEKDEIPKQHKFTDVNEAPQLIVLEQEHQRFYDKLRKKIGAFLQKKTTGQLDKYLLLAPDLFVLLARLMKDRRVPAKSKALAGLAVAYFISPVDFLPEVIVGPIGFLDDIVLAAYAISKIMQDVEPSILKEHWSGESDLLAYVQELLKKAEELVDGKILGKLKGLLNKK